MEWYWWLLIVAVLALFVFIKVKAIGMFFAWRKKRDERMAAQIEEQEL